MQRLVLPGVEVYCGDCLEIVPELEGINVVVTDPPYGISYCSNMEGALPRSIMGDESTELRDAIVAWCEAQGIPAIMFGTWKAPRPANVKARLIWEKNVGGMGDLKMPWSPMDEEIYVMGKGFSGKRESNVLRVRETIVTWNSRGRTHPHEKPVSLLGILLKKCPAGTVLDPFMGSGSTILAAIRTGRKAIGIEKDPEHFKNALERIKRELAQGDLFLGQNTGSQPCRKPSTETSET